MFRQAATRLHLVGLTDKTFLFRLGANFDDAQLLDAGFVLDTLKLQRLIRGNLEGIALLVKKHNDE